MKIYALVKLTFFILGLITLSIWMYLNPYVATFLTPKNFICISVIVLSVLALFIPNHILDTSTCKRNWVVVLLILSSASFLIDSYEMGIFLGFSLFIALIIHFMNSFLKSKRV